MHSRTMELHQVLHGGHPTVTSCYSDATSCLRYWDYLNQSYSDVPILPTFMYSLCSAVIVIRLEIYMHHMTITSVQLSRVSVCVSYINPKSRLFYSFTDMCVFFTAFHLLPQGRDKTYVFTRHRHARG